MSSQRSTIDKNGEIIDSSSVCCGEKNLVMSSDGILIDLGPNIAKRTRETTTNLSRQQEQQLPSRQQSLSIVDSGRRSIGQFVRRLIPFERSSDSSTSSSSACVPGSSSSSCVPGAYSITPGRPNRWRSSLLQTLNGNGDVVSCNSRSMRRRSSGNNNSTANDDEESTVVRTTTSNSRHHGAEFQNPIPSSSSTSTNSISLGQAALVSATLVEETTNDNSGNNYYYNSSMEANVDSSNNLNSSGITSSGIGGGNTTILTVEASPATDLMWIFTQSRKLQVCVILVLMGFAIMTGLMSSSLRKSKQSALRNNNHYSATNSQDGGMAQENVPTFSPMVDNHMSPTSMDKPTLNVGDRRTSHPAAMENIDTSSLLSIQTPQPTLISQTTATSLPTKHPTLLPTRTPTKEPTRSPTNRPPTRPPTPYVKSDGTNPDEDDNNLNDNEDGTSETRDDGDAGESIEDPSTEDINEPGGGVNENNDPENEEGNNVEDPNTEDANEPDGGNENNDADPGNEEDNNDSDQEDEVEEEVKDKEEEEEEDKSNEEEEEEDEDKEEEEEEKDNEEDEKEKDDGGGDDDE